MSRQPILPWRDVDERHGWATRWGNRGVDKYIRRGRGEGASDRRGWKRARTVDIYERFWGRTGPKCGFCLVWTIGIGLASWALPSIIGLPYPPVGGPQQSCELQMRICIKWCLVFSYFYIFILYIFYSSVASPPNRREKESTSKATRGDTCYLQFCYFITVSTLQFN